MRLEEIMAALAAGDRAMVFALVEEFGTELAAQVRRVARDHNRSLTSEELNDLVMDSAFVLADVASAWKPDGGALPWTWARGRVRAVVFAEIFGPYPIDPADLAVEEDPEVSSPVRVTTTEPDWSGVFSDLASKDRRVAELARALEGVSARNREVFIQFRLQKQSDPSPANTVGEMFGLTSDNVRQIVKRVRNRLRSAGVEVAV